MKYLLIIIVIFSFATNVDAGHRRHNVSRSYASSSNCANGQCNKSFSFSKSNSPCANGSCKVKTKTVDNGPSPPAEPK